MTQQPHAILALIPAWNEAERIGPVLQGVLTYVPALVVADGSQDATAAVAAAAGAQVVRHEVNRGKGAALATGFAWALAHAYKAVLTLDADGQHDPVDIPRFLDAYRAGGSDLIIGRRDFRVMPFPRGYTNPFGSWLLSKALGVRLWDNQSGFRLYTRRVLESLRPTTTGFEYEVDVIAQAVYAGMTIGWVPIRTIYGIEKVSYFRPIRDSLRFIGTVWRIWRQRPARQP